MYIDKKCFRRRHEYIRIEDTKKNVRIMNIYNTKDIAHFDKLHSMWWDKNGPLKTLHAINPVRLQYIKKFSNIKNKLILDIGCGGGIFSYSMAMHNAKVIGIDPSKKLIKIAKKKYISI